MEDYKLIRCPHCDDECIGYGDGHELCEKCGSINEVTDYKDITNADVILEIVGAELENANFHTIESLPRDIFDSIKKHIKPDDYAVVARDISETIYRVI